MAVDSATLSLIGILAITAITPGPNNILVLHAALTGGIRDAVRAIAGVISGSIMLLGVVAVGFRQFADNSTLQSAMTIGGTSYLVWLGVTLCSKVDPASHQTLDAASLPSAYLSIAFFQLLNPKAWLLMSIVITAGSPTLNGFWLVLLLVIVFTTCLSIWAYSGLFLSKYLQQSHRVVWFNRIMGSALILFALMLLHQGIRS